ncbi:MAG TPA: hypothetical protein VLG76_07070, partial [Rhabdochlamydiaceae bacterium]|nr:hypothetical protein [Rhabdochlamydiaceae bacterium]
LLAFKQKKISRFQIGTLLHFWAAIQHHNEAGKGAFAPEAIDFFMEDGRTVNPRAVLLLRETFENGHENFGLRTKEEWDCFIAEIGKLPRSEQQFFKIPCLLDFGPPGYHKSGKTILERVEFSGGYAAFGLLRDEKHVLLETMGMAQAYINATKKGSEKSAQINIVIGHSSPEDIEKNGFDHIRDVAVHFPGIKELPRYPDGFYGPWIYFTKHDFFHAKALDAIGQQWARRIVKTWHNLPFLGTEEEQAVQKQIKEFIIDLDAPEFRDKYPPEIAFWCHFAFAFNHYATNCLSEKTEELVLRQIFSRLVKGYSGIGAWPEGKLEKYKPMMRDERYPIIYNLLYSTPTGKLIPVLWREQKGIDPEWLRGFKAELLAEESAEARKKMVEQARPFLSSKNVVDLLKFSTEEGNEIKCAELKEVCEAFAKDYSADI